MLFCCHLVTIPTIHNNTLPILIVRITLPHRIVRKANGRMALLRKLSEFGAQKEDLKDIYILYIRSILEQSSVVWHTSLSEQNIQDMERVQKSALTLILNNKCKDYQKALNILGLDTLKDRREVLNLNFIKTNFKNGTFSDLIQTNKKQHTMNTRNCEQFQVLHANTERLKTSTIPQMQRMLNQHKNEVTH